MLVAQGSFEIPFGFTGEQTDANDLVYLRARYLSPKIGTFLSLDPFEGMASRPMSLNGYNWVEGNTAQYGRPKFGAWIMVEYDPVPVSDDSYDVLIEANFVAKLTPLDVINISEIILEIAKSKAAEGIFFVGFAAVEVNLEKVKVQFRFSMRQQDIAKLTFPERDELPRSMARFTWHLFAKIDDRYKLGRATLPDGFRSYINLDE